VAHKKSFSLLSFSIYAGWAFCELSMWWYFCLLFGRVSAIERSDELWDGESVTPAFSRSTTEVLFFPDLLRLLVELKKCFPHLRPSDWQKLGLWQPSGHNSFSVRWRFEFRATCTDFDLGPLGLLPFCYLAFGGWDIRVKLIRPLGFRNKCILRHL
jgi:hypothetical protein